MPAMLAFHPGAEAIRCLLRAMAHSATDAAARLLRVSQHRGRHGPGLLSCGYCDWRAACLRASCACPRGTSCGLGASWVCMRASLSCGKGLPLCLEGHCPRDKPASSSGRGLGTKTTRERLDC